MRARTLRKAALLGVLLLAGCATRAPQGARVSQDRFDRLVVPGHTTRAELLAAFGPTKSIRFGSGVETWLYEADAGGGRHTELVLLLDPSGVVRKMRTRPPYPTDSTDEAAD
jgi:outer membrane protein assembly factor BamE (lipoprotein component of BamABCDE complex)